MATHVKQYLSRASKISCLYVLLSIILSNWASGEEYKQGIPNKAQKAGNERGSNREGKAKQTLNLNSEDNSFIPEYSTLQDVDKATIQFINKALERIPPNLQKSVPYLTELAKDQDAEMRLSAVVALKVNKPKADEAIPILIKLLNDPDKIVFTEALFTIASYKTEVERELDLREVEARVIARFAEVFGMRTEQA